MGKSKTSDDSNIKNIYPTFDKLFKMSLEKLKVEEKNYSSYSKSVFYANTPSIISHWTEAKYLNCIQMTLNFVGKFVNQSDTCILEKINSIHVFINIS